MFPITIILPTYNERESLSILLPQIKRFGYPIIVVDDNSPDRTCDIATSHGIHVFCREDERGLGSAIRRGAELAKTPYVAVMDTDGQHHPLDLLTLITLLEKEQGLTDIVVGSRLRFGGSIRGLPEWRKLATKILNWLGGLRAETKTTDYLTGMFACRRELVVNTHENGFKLLYDILKNNRVKLAELPITLYERQSGKSKASFKEITNYLKLVFS
jgi:dolichol-phosphate mannosyltransferase